MPEFVPVLVAAVLMLVMLLIAFGGSMFTIDGMQNKTYSKTINLGGNLSVFYVEGQRSFVNLGGESSGGLLGGMSQRAEFSVSDYADVSEGLVRLRVWNSNYYGELMVSINGNQIYRGAPTIGEQTILFSPNVLGPINTISVDAESSGWKIWAPNIYIFNATVMANYIGKETQSLSFDLTQQEALNVKRARLLIFASRSGTGNIMASLNGRQIYSGLTTVYTDFAIDNLKEGTNVLDLSTERNTVYNISSAQIVLFY